jgi:hypothetical protein
MPMWRKAGSPSGQRVASAAKASRAYGMGARLKYSAYRSVERHLHHVGVEELGASRDAVAGGGDCGLGSGELGATAGPARADQRLVALHVDHDAVGGRRSFATTSASGRCRRRGRARHHASTPCAGRTGDRGMIGGDDTSAAPLAGARSATRTTIGLPAMSASGLPGKAWRRSGRE